MRSFFILCALACAPVLVGQNAYLRMHVTLQTTNQASAATVRDFVLARVSDNDRFNLENKNINIRILTNSPTVGNYRLDADYIFASTNKAATVWNQVTNVNMPAAVKGKVSLHYCPLEGAIRDWQGCDQDSRSNYKEFLW